MLLRSAVVLVALLVGCAAEPATTPAASSSEDAADTRILAETITDTLIVEGYPEPVTLRLVREDDGPLPFATYVPGDVAYDATASGEGAGYRFTLGDPDQPYHAVLHVFVPSAESGLGDPRAYAQALAGSAALQPLGDAAPWVEAAYSWRREGRFGSVLAGTREGQRFYVAEDLQEEMGDGFAPRANMILRHWRWFPEGTPLGR